MKKPSFTDFLTDIRVNVMEEFDRNFERKAFFDQPWKNVKFPNRKGSLMMRSGALRRSLKSNVQGNLIRFWSSQAYAGIHNDGGEITVTDKMKRFFWAMHYKALGGIRYNVKTKSAVFDKRGQRLSQEARMWKFMALKKAGGKIKIDARTFIGYHPRVDVMVKEAADHYFKGLEMYIRDTLKR